MTFFDVPVDLLAMLPENLREVRELEEICAAASAQIERINAQINSIAQNAFVKTAFGEGLSRWEGILSIASPLNSSESSRREALAARLSAKPPINVAALKTVVETYMGVKTDVAVLENIICITYRGQTRISDLTPLYKTAYELVPASLLITVSYRYPVWLEIDAKMMDFNRLDALALNWRDFEMGEWI